MNGSSLEPSHAVGFRTSGTQKWLGAMLTLGSERGAEVELTTSEDGFSLKLNSKDGPIKIGYRRMKDSLLVDVTIGEDKFSQVIPISEEK
jgi:hypothetical protein